MTTRAGLFRPRRLAVTNDLRPDDPGDTSVDPDVDIHVPAQRREMTGPGHRILLPVIALGGAIGAEARYGLTQLIPSPAGAVPWAIVTANIVGALLMGVLMARLARHEQPNPLIRPFLGVGVLGGFTTFSTYSTDTFYLIDAGRVGTAIGYLAVTLAGALLAVWLGQTLAADRPRTAASGASGPTGPTGKDRS